MRPFVLCAALFVACLAQAGEVVLRLDANGRLLAPIEVPRGGDLLVLSVEPSGGEALEAACDSTVPDDGYRVRWSLWPSASPLLLGAAPSERYCLDGSGSFPLPRPVREGEVAVYELLRVPGTDDRLQLKEERRALEERQEELRRSPAAKVRELELSLRLLADQIASVGGDASELTEQIGSLRRRLESHEQREQELEGRIQEAVGEEVGQLRERLLGIRTEKSEVQAELSGAEATRVALAARLSSLELERRQAEALKDSVASLDPERARRVSLALSRLRQSIARLEGLEADLREAPVLLLKQGEVAVGRHREAWVLTPEGRPVSDPQGVDPRGALDIYVANVPLSQKGGYLVGRSQGEASTEIRSVARPLGPDEFGPLSRDLRLPLEGPLRGGRDLVFDLRRTPAADASEEAATLYQGVTRVHRVHYMAVSLGLVVGSVEDERLRLAADASGSRRLLLETDRGYDPVAVLAFYPRGRREASAARRPNALWPAPVLAFSLDEPGQRLYAGVEWEPLRSVVVVGGLQWRKVRRYDVGLGERQTVGPEYSEISFNEGFETGAFVGLSFRLGLFGVGALSLL